MIAENFESLEHTYLRETNLRSQNPTNIPELLSAARSEFYLTDSYAGKMMTEVARVLSIIGQKVYGTGFIWTDYNRGQWDDFVKSRASSLHGGRCMFSLEPDCNYEDQDAHLFKGLGIGVPTGACPYTLWVCHVDSAPLLKSAILSIGKYTLDLIH